MAQTEAPAYLINIGDELDIKIDEHGDLNASVKVRPDGRITLPIIGDLLALGKTPTALENEIVQGYQGLAVQNQAVGAGADKQYLISVNDELVIKFPYHDKMDQTVKVRPDGFISLSLVNDVGAENKTPELLEAELNRRYRKFLKNPNLTVIVKQFSTLHYQQNGKTGIAGLDNIKATVIVKTFEPLEIFVAGNVEKPGILLYRPTLTAMGAIIEAGGYKLGAEMSSVVLVRKHDKNPMSFKLNLADEGNLGQDSNDVPLKPYDVVYVPKSTINEMGDFVQDLGRILPPLRHSSFSFLYDIVSGLSSGSAIATQK